MPSTTVTRKATRLLRTAPVKLEAIADKMSSDELYEVGTHLEWLATAAAFLAEYLTYRRGYGCGDQGHKASLKAANKARRAVRKAFGYNTTVDINV